MRRFTPVLPALGALLVACGPGDDGATAPDVPGANHVRALAVTIQRADALADSVEDLLRPVSLMRPADEAALRRYLNAAHVTRARELGVRVRSEEHRDSLLAEELLIPLEDSTRHWVVRRHGDGDLVVPHTRSLLEEIGTRFQERLAERGLPPYRIEITSTLRTAAGQARLRRGNPNAAAGVSSHEFGTTVDIAYGAYPPPRELLDALRVEAPPEIGPLLERVAAVTLESVSARKSRELKAILGEVLRDAQEDGIVRVIHERYQPVYHVTVARALAD